MIINGIVTQEKVSPSYEVKYLLDSSIVLDKDHKLKDTYKKMFEVEGEPINISMVFLDNKNRDFNSQGWANRIRVEDGKRKHKFGLTYKKRYPVKDGDVDAVLEQAGKDGFYLAESLFSAEVDWGYSNMTLSLSCNMGKRNIGHEDMELPKKAEATEMIMNMMPGIEEELVEASVGKKAFKNIKKIGPVSFVRNVGKYKDTLVDIEVMPLTNKDGKTTYITELSFRKFSYDEANAFRTDLMDFLDKAGIMKHEDSLKTQAIYNAFLGDK